MAAEVQEEVVAPKGFHHVVVNVRTANGSPNWQLVMPVSRRPTLGGWDDDRNERDQSACESAYRAILAGHVLWGWPLDALPYIGRHVTLNAIHMRTVEAARQDYEGDQGVYGL